MHFRGAIEPFIYEGFSCLVLEILAMKVVSLLMNIIGSNGPTEQQCLLPEFMAL